MFQMERKGYSREFKLEAFNLLREYGVRSCGRRVILVTTSTRCGAACRSMMLVPKQAFPGSQDNEAGAA
jgi:hypothetical protein